jgi:hypothetical protein
MIFWTREIIGWALVALGLFTFFGLAYFGLIARGKIVDSAPVTFMAFIIFRGGIHLIKVSVAIRLAQHGIDDAKTRKTSSLPSRIVTDRRPIIPGTSNGR